MWLFHLSNMKRDNEFLAKKLNSKINAPYREKWLVISYKSSKLNFLLFQKFSIFILSISFHPNVFASSMWSFLLKLQAVVRANCGCVRTKQESTKLLMNTHMSYSLLLHQALLIYINNNIYSKPSLKYQYKNKLFLALYGAGN